MRDRITTTTLGGEYSTVLKNEQTGAKNNNNNNNNEKEEVQQCNAIFLFSFCKERRRATLVRSAQRTRCNCRRHFFFSSFRSAFFFLLSTTPFPFCTCSQTHTIHINIYLRYTCSTRKFYVGRSIPHSYQRADFHFLFLTVRVLRTQSLSSQHFMLHIVLL